MATRMFRKMSDYVHRSIQRAFLKDPGKATQRLSIAMASILLISIIVTYNVLYEKKIREEGIRPVSVAELWKERDHKKRLERIELQRSIIKARNQPSANEAIKEP